MVEFKGRDPLDLLVAGIMATPELQKVFTMIVRGETPPPSAGKALEDLSELGAISAGNGEEYQLTLLGQKVADRVTQRTLDFLLEDDDDEDPSKQLLQ
mgnify:CR=1 FL=1